MNTTLQDSLDSLQTLSLAFEAMAADPKNYHTDLALMLDGWAFELRKMRSQTFEHIYTCGGF